jgi:hypothetical protein
MSYNVNIWDTNPELGEDTCNTGKDFAELGPALEAYYHPEDKFRSVEPYQWVEIDGPDIYECRQVVAGARAPADDDWRRESAMQAGMAFGCAGYNDYMGY